MAADKPRPVHPMTALLVVMVLAAVVIALLEHTSQQLLAAQAATGYLPRGAAPFAALLNRYLRLRYHVLDHWIFYSIVFTFGPILVLLGIKKWIAALYAWREKASGFAFKQERYDLPRVEFSLREALLENPDPDSQVVLGADEKGRVVYLTDRARSMHVHVLGQTGSGKTKSVIEPLMFQDIRRRRGVLVVDGKGSEENHHRLVSMAALVGRLDEVRIFTLSPFWPTHTYNPLHLVSGSDPRAVAERVFSSFADDMDVPYYRDQSRMFFVALVCALASTGQRFCMLDVAAAIASPDVLARALELATDMRAKRAMQAQLSRLGHKAGETFTGLLAAVQRYDIPAVNAYEPDIVLEQEIERGGIVAFYLPANYYKQLARYIGLVVFQHIQQVGALRQLDRSRSQKPLYVFADEFYSFAYEGFTDAVNKLRDAHVSILLSHQTFSDLEKVSPEYAKGIWDNTRNKVILYQNDPDVCDRISKAVGTQKGVELTVRRSADAFLNSFSTLEASSREVDSYRLHPNRVKALLPGQAYVVQDADFAGVNLQQLPELPRVAPPCRRGAEAPGLRLYELFLQGEAARPAP